MVDGSYERHMPHVVDPFSEGSRDIRRARILSPMIVF